jgi:hypothetical protein
MIVTTGTKGSDGRDTRTLAEELFCQPTQGISFDNTRHFARIRDSFNLKASPTFNKPASEAGDDGEDARDIGYNEKL